MDHAERGGGELEEGEDLEVPDERDFGVGSYGRRVEGVGGADVLADGEVSHASDDEGGYIGGEEAREGFDYKYVVLDECAKCEGKQDNMERWSCYTLCTECSDKVAEFILE